MSDRVLQVLGVLDRGGAETMIMNLYRNVDREKIQFDFIVHTDSCGAYGDEVITYGGCIYYAPSYKGINHSEYVQWWKDFFAKHQEHGVIHSHVRSTAAIFLPIAQKAGKVTVSHSHSTSDGKGIKSILKSLLRKNVERSANYCLACSVKAGKWLYPHRTFTVLNNAIDTDRFRFNKEVRTETREEFGITAELLLGTVGNIAEVKNPFGMIDILKAVKKIRPDTKLLWVGNKGALYQQVEEKLKMEGLMDAVIMTGVRSDVDRLMQAMDVFILPSLWEGLPVVLMEAQAAGLPCFVSDTVTTESAITDLCTFLPLGAPEKWADAILTTDLSQRRDTSQEIRDAGYDIKTTAKWLEDFYLGLSTEIEE